MAFKKRFKAEAGSQKSRKELRKQQRILKKVKKNDHFMKKHLKGNKKASPNVTMVDTDPDSCVKDTNKCLRAEAVKKSLVKRIHAASKQKQARMDKRKLNEKKSRFASLKEANVEEDKTIHQLEVLMKMNKRKKAGKLPKIFEDDGLDYILDVTDSDKINQMNPETPLFEEDDDGDMFEDDPVAKTASSELNNVETWHPKLLNANIGEKDVEDDNDDPMFSDDSIVADSGDSDDAEVDSASYENIEDEVSSPNEDHGNASVELSNKNYRVKQGTNVTFDSNLPKINDDNGNTNTKKKKSSSGKATAVWEDIYGRLRDPSGNVLSQKDAGRYVPPAQRARQMALSADRQETLVVLRRRLQGQLNRLSASTLRPILALVSDLYGQHSRHDVSDTLTQLIHQSCVSSASVSSQRIVAEHILLLAALHCSVGSEVGAHFLQKTALRFHCLLESSSTDDEDNKEPDNLLMLLCYLYCLRVTDHLVVSDILGMLTDSFSARDTRLILVALCCVGFHMRKQQPLLLKQHIVAIQQRATQTLSNSTSEDMQSRVRFMLDSLLAIRNNNVAKLPQYDAQLQLHMQQLLSHNVRDDPAANQLSICLQDLLNSEERGKWWVVGSAWSGQLKERRDASSSDLVLDQENDQQALQRQLYSAELLRLAAQQRMNTDLRRNVFCVLMSAEDYVDCHERLLRLGLRGPQQLQEMTAVVFECALRETRYNPYYSHLLELLCSSNRRFQMYVRVAVWERLGDSSRLTETASLSSNLAQILSHLIRSGQLTIAVLKVLEFSELDRPLVRLLRQLLLSLMMLDEDAGGVRLVFSKATGAPLKALRDSLVLFLHHFILRKRQKLLTADKFELMESRVQLAVTCLRTSTADLTF